MPYCFVKCRLPQSDRLKLYRHPELEFHSAFNETTGEVSKRRFSEYKGLKFYSKGPHIWLAGSLHKYVNEGIHNHNDCHIDQIIKAIRDIELRFDIQAEDCKLENVEFGVNISPGYSANKILDNLLYHEVQKFKDVDLGNQKGYFKKATHGRYSIKAYNKSEQYHLTTNILRFELHFNKMIDLQKLDIKNLSDLKNREKAKQIGQLLTKKWNEVFLYDWTLMWNTKEKKPKDADLWRSNTYWIEELDKRNRYKRKAKYVTCTRELSQQIHSALEKQFRLKIDDMLSPKGDHLTTPLRSINGDLLTAKCKGLNGPPL